MVQKQTVLLFILLSLFSIARTQDTLFIDGKGKGRIFDGICGVNAGGGVGRLLINYPEPQRSEILDLLFKPNFGASFQAYKAEIGGDGNSTEGAEPSHMHTANDQNYNRGYQWWMMKEAKKRNPAIKLMALAWDYPAWIKEVNSEEAANYLVNYIKGAKAVHNLDIDYIGIWNETKTDNAFIKRLRKTLNANGLQRVKIMADDQVRNWSIADSMLQDKALSDAIDVVETHYPKYESTPAAKNIGKPIWSAEDGPWDDQWSATGQQSGPLAKLLNLNYIVGKMTSTNIWNIVTAYYDILDIPYAGLIRAMTPWSGHYQPMSPLWVVAHTTQFAYPGWQYIDTACKELEKGGSLVTLKHDKDYSIIIETIGALENQTLTCKVSDGLSQKKLSVWRTDSSDYFQKIEEITLVNGVFSIEVNKNSVYSITTTTGQHQGITNPSDKPFLLPYKDDFEKYKTGNTTANYFIEQNGSYEVVNAGYGRKGKALRQVVSQSPIVWTYGNTAHLLGTASIIGDERWSNYSVSSDILLEEPGYAHVMGRVSRVTLDGQINGYQLYVTDKGEWKLKYSTTQEALDSGRYNGKLTTWHRLKLSFHDSAISAFIDGKKVTEIRDHKFSAGMAGIGNDYNKGLYDNFEIAPLDATVPVIPKEEVQNNYFFEKIPDPPYMHTCLPLKNAVKVSWDPVLGAKGYKIHFGTTEGEYTSVTDVGNLTSYTVWTLESSRKYYFVVTAYNNKGESKPSGVEAATVK